MTLTEKILARASGKAKVQAGDNIWVNADVLMTHDVCGPGTIGVFKREFGKTAKVWDKNKIVIIPDHYIFTADSKSNRNVDILRDFVKEQACRIFTTSSTTRTVTGSSTPPRATPSASTAPNTRACATRRSPPRATRVPAKFCSARIRTPAWPARSTSSPRASATRTRVL